MDHIAIAAALVARFTGITPPNGEQAIAEVSADPPSQLGLTPAIYVFGPPVEETFEWGPSLLRHSEQTWRATFVRAHDGDVPFRLAAMRKWWPLLIDRVVGQIQLGLAYVDWAELRRMELTSVTWAEIKYDAIDIEIDVKTREAVPTAHA